MTEDHSFSSGPMPRHPHHTHHPHHPHEHHPRRSDHPHGTDADRHGHRPGPGGRGARFAALLTDQPIGTEPEALAEAFVGIGQLLRARARAQHRGAHRRDRGLTFARAALLAALDSDGPQRMGELAHRLGVVPRTVTPMVDALAADGLLVREPDPDDRRATLLRITEAGTAELGRTRSERQSTLDDVFAALSQPEREALAGILDRLRTAARDGLDPTDVDAGPGPDGEPHGGPGGGFRNRPGRGRGFGRPQHHGRIGRRLHCDH